MENIVCKSCGGSVTRQGNYYVCDFCRSKWMIDSGNDVQAVERANAWEALRNNNFEKAAELFEGIITKDSSSHEAYWGRALAMNGIVYVNDYIENKKVPTCNNITEDSFLDNKDVKKAISLAPSDIQESYHKQAEQIEKIRIEWLEKASKEPEYDVFISFKDSDREHGIERTQDSVDVQDLYTALVSKGYNVFFSRVTLRDKVSEQYEPYIYNALKTAKVMIVFGEKAEYFNAVWVKNEWSRFKKRIEKGEKHKNSLITVYKNVNPYEIPVALTGGRQAIDYSIPSNYEVLMNHVKRVIAESEQAVHLDRIEIKGGQMSKKSSKIETQTLQTRELGTGVNAQTSISEMATLRLVGAYIKADKKDSAIQIVEDVLFNNPNNVEALIYKLQIAYLAKSEMEAYEKCAIDNDMQEFVTLERILNCCEKEKATEILKIMYEKGQQKNADSYHELLERILPYAFDGREECIDNATKYCIENLYNKTFKLLLSTLHSEDVDKYIKYNLEYAKKENYKEFKIECIDKVLGVEEGNTVALDMYFDICLEDDDSKKALEILEKKLKYSKDTKSAVLYTLKRIKKALNSNADCEIFRGILRYYPGELSEIKELLLDVSFVMIENECFEHAEYILKLLCALDNPEPRIYLALCFVKLKVTRVDGIIFSDVALSSIPEYMKYLTLVDEQEQVRFIKIEESQSRQIKFRENKRKLEEERREQKIKEEQEREKIAKEKQIRLEKARKTRKKHVIIALIVLALIAIPIIISTSISESNRLKSMPLRNGCKLEMSSNGYVVTGIEPEYKDDEEIIIPESYDGLLITEIKSRAFYGCSNLKTVKFGENCKIDSIGDYAFGGCSSLTSITIPDSVTSIGESVFYGCDKLQKIALPFVGTTTKLKHIFGILPDSLKEVVITSATSILKEAFYLCSSLTSITIPDGVTSIGDYAFYGCSSLTSITIPNSVTSIGEYAFLGCDKLQKITLPFVGTTTKLKHIFGYSVPDSLKHVVITSATSIGEDAFWYCDSLTSITIPDGVTSIGKNAFYRCSSLTSVTIPDSVTSIGEYAFYNCSSLKSVTIPDSVTSIGMSAFYDCSNLIRINYLGKIDKWAQISFGNICSNPLYYAKKLYIKGELVTEAVLSTATKISSYAFYCCSSLTSITIPDSVTSIGDYAFQISYSGTIYCETNSRPSGWDSSWCGFGSEVVWGYAG